MPQATQTIQSRSFEQYVNTNRTQIAALSSTALEVECPGCRAQVTFQPPDVAGRCPFCDTGIVAQPHSPDPLIAPEAVLPFAITEKAARAEIVNWLGRRWFAPRQLKQLAQQEKIQGVYLPFWIYDCQTRSRYRGERGEHYYTTETYTETNSEGKSETKTRQVQHTRWRSASGEVSRTFSDMLIPASTAVATKRLDQLEPWQLSQLQPYDPAYLAGFKAQRYQVTLKAGFDTAKQRMEDPIRSDVRRDIGGDEQRIHSIDTIYLAVMFRHLLLPVWLCVYQFRQKRYQVIVNAQTGEVLGDRPYSKSKIAGTIAAGLSLVAGGFGVKSYLDNPNQFPLPQLPTITQPASPTNPAVTALDPNFQQAMLAAQRASSLAQTAQTRANWQRVVQNWTEAITYLQQIPASSPSYASAQSKIVEYQKNLGYARQRLAATE